jgi:hypothetical protein
MIDETLLHDALAELAATIPLPADGPDRVLLAADTRSAPNQPNRSKFMRPLLVAAVVLAVLGVAAIAVHGSSRTSTSSSAKRAILQPAQGGAAERSLGNGSANLAPSAGIGAPTGIGGTTAIHGPTANGSTGPSKTTTAATGPVDAAKIVKTGTLDLQVPHATLRLAVNRVTAAAVGLGGYVAQSKTSYGGTDPTAEVTIRVPVDQFDTAITRLDALPDVKVLGDSENGVDVTGQVHDLQAQLKAAIGARDSFLRVLAQANTIGDILAVTDRESAAQTVVDQLQGRINTLDGQATFSALAVTLSEKPVGATKAAVHHSKPETGLAKSWSDATGGFADAVEWLIARSGAALIALLAALALLFGIRYLYPVVRRGLV